MKISSLPQESGLSPLYPSPANLLRPEFIGNAIVQNNDGNTHNVSLYQCNQQYQNADTKVVAVTEFGTSYVFMWRKIFNLNCFIAEDILKNSSIVSVTFCSEWL